MVKHSPAYLDLVFHALSDATRRDMLNRISQGTVSLSGLASTYSMSLPAVTKHLSVLEACGLVASDKVGRIRKCELNAAPLKGAMDWIDGYRPFWEGQLSNLEKYLSMDVEGKNIE